MPMCMLSKEFQNQFHCGCVSGGAICTHIETILGHQLRVPQFNSILTLLKSSVLQDYPLPPTPTKHTHIIKCQLKLKVVTYASD